MTRSLMVCVAWLALASASLLHAPSRGPTTLTAPRAISPRACAAPSDDFERVEVAFDTAPPTVADGGGFAALDLPSQVAANLAALNISAPNALQRASFAPLAAGRDGVLHAPTGSGKTLAFLLPLIAQLDAASREPQALVLCPSRELAFQTHRVAQQLLADSGLRSGIVAGGANPNRQIERLRKERPQLLIGTAGRVGELAYESKKLKLQRVRHLVLDEVDEALVAPHAEPTRRVLDDVSDGRPLQLLFCSATADTPPTRRAALQLMRPPPLLLRLRGAAAGPGGAKARGAELPSTIAHGVVAAPARRHLEVLRGLMHTEPKPTVLAFVNSPHRVGVVVDRLWTSYGVAAAPLVGGQEREERVDVMRRLVDGKVRLVVCTEMGARGLDLPHLTHVVNLELPTDAAHYAHRAGRCGRAGRAGTVVSVVADDRAFVVDKIAAQLGVEVTPMRLYEGKLVEGAEPAAPRPAAARRPAAAPPAGAAPKPAASGGGGGGGGGAPRLKVKRDAPPNPTDAPPKHSRTVVKPKGKKARADAARERAKAARARPSV